MKNRAEQAPLHLYTPEPFADALLVRWWYELRASGDLDLIFDTPPTLSLFMKLMQEPTALVVKVEGEGAEARIWFAAWFDPVYAGAFFNLWIAPDRRHGRAALEAMVDAARLGLAQFSCLIGVTKQEGLVKQHLKFGYRLLGTLPAFYSGQEAWILVLDKEGLERKWGRVLRSKAVGSGQEQRAPEQVPPSPPLSSKPSPRRPISRRRKVALGAVYQFPQSGRSSHRL